MTAVIIDRGYGFDLEFELLKTDGTAELASGTTAAWKLAESNTATAPLLTKSGLSATTSGGKTLVTVSLTAQETEALLPGRKFHQLAVTLTGGQPRIYFIGNLTVSDRL